MSFRGRVVKAFMFLVILAGSLVVNYTDANA